MQRSPWSRTRLPTAAWRPVLVGTANQCLVAAGRAQPRRLTAPTACKRDRSSWNSSCRPGCAPSLFSVCTRSVCHAHMLRVPLVCGESTVTAHASRRDILRPPRRRTSSASRRRMAHTATCNTSPPWLPRVRRWPQPARAYCALNHGSRRRLRLAAGDGAAAGARRGELVRWHEREDGPAGRARTAHTCPHGPVGARYRFSAPFAASPLAAPLRNAAPRCATHTRALKVPPASVYVRRDGSYAGKRGDPYHEAPRAPVPWRARYTPLTALAHTLTQHRLVFRRGAGTSSLFTWAASCTS